MSYSRGYRIAAVALSLTLGVVACSSSGKGGSSDTASKSAPPAAAGCTGKAVKVTLIQSLTGPAAFPGIDADTRDAVKAATTAINSACPAGVPLTVTICDDKSDPNQSTKCGRAAKSDGSLALLETGTFETGAGAAGLPGVLTNGTSTFDATNPKSYPSESPLTVVLATLTAAKAAGAKDYTFAAFQSAQTQFIVSQSQALGQQIGLKVNPLFFPANTTDFAPIAAQIKQRNPGAVGMAVPAIVPMINALDAAGVKASTTPIFTAVNLVPPSVLKQLGAKANGLYLTSSQVPPTDPDNTGIKQMLAEFKAAGVTRSPTEIGTSAVDVWSKVHILGDAVAKVGKAGAASLDSTALIAALVALGDIKRPEYAPMNFQKPAFGADFPALTHFRIFSRDALVVHIVDGGYKVVAPFSDVTKPFTLKG